MIPEGVKVTKGPEKSLRLNRRFDFALNAYSECFCAVFFFVLLYLKALDPPLSRGVEPYPLSETNMIFK